MKPMNSAAPMPDLSQPCVMGILNVTPDSFYADSRRTTREAVEQRAREIVDEGAAIIDIGGYSSRPGADEVPVEEEWRRVALGLKAVRRVAPGAAVSVDTFRSEVVERAVAEFGPVTVNDISAGELDPRMVPTVARLGVPYVAMHMQGDPRTMQSLTNYRRDIVTEVVDYVECRCGQLLAAGVSRKSMIYKALDATPAESLAGTVALGWECLRQGASVLRVHDVREAADTVRLFRLYEKMRHGDGK